MVTSLYPALRSASNSEASVTLSTAVVCGVRVPRGAMDVGCGLDAWDGVLSWPVVSGGSANHGQWRASAMEPAAIASWDGRAESGKRRSPATVTQCPVPG